MTLTGERRLMTDQMPPHPDDECMCGDYRHQHHDLGCSVCVASEKPWDGCRRFRLAFRLGERDRAERA